MTIENLLVTDYVKQIDSINYKNFRNIKAPTVFTDKKLFGLKDKTDSCVVNEDEAVVSYNNPQSKQVAITNYEEFVESLPKNLQNGRKRCDFLVYQEGATVFFILNELSQSHNIDSKESRALLQLSESLQALCDVEPIKERLESCSIRVCLFSNRLKKTQVPLEMVEGFYKTFATANRVVEPLFYEDINKHGFVYYRANYIEIGNEVLFKNKFN